MEKYIQQITEDYVQNHDEYFQALKDYISQDYKSVPLDNHTGQRSQIDNHLKHMDEVYEFFDKPQHVQDVMPKNYDTIAKKNDITSYFSAMNGQDKTSRFLFYLLRKVDELESKVNKQDNKLRSKSKIKAIKKEADILQSMMHGEKKKTKKRSKRPKRSKKRSKKPKRSKRPKRR